MNHLSNVTTEIDPITVTVAEQRTPARVRPERPVRRLRRGTSLRPVASQDGASPGETAGKPGADAASGAPEATTGVALPMEEALPQPSRSFAEAWRASDAGHDEYDELLASVLSDDEGQPDRSHDPAADDHASGVITSRDESPAVTVEAVASTHAAAGSGALPPTEDDPMVVKVNDEVEVSEGASSQESAPAAGTRGSDPTEETSASPRDELDFPHSPELLLEAADGAQDEASTLAAEILPVSRTRARRNRAAVASAATLPEQPIASPLAPLESEMAEPAPLPSAPLYVWQGTTLMPAQVRTQPTSAPTSPISGPARDVEEPTETAPAAPAESSATPQVTDAACAPMLSTPSLDLPETRDGVSATPSTPATDESDGSAAPAAATEVMASQTTISAAGREVTALQPLVPGAALDTATFVRQVRDAELRDAAPVLSPVHAVPDGGWRSAVLKLTLGRVQPSPSARQAERDHEIYRVRTPLNGNRHIVVLAYGTGVGKTLTTGAIGLQFAEHRDDRVAVIDADQTAGNLADRFATPADRFLQDLLDNHQHSAVDSIVELRRYARSAKRLDIYSADHARTYTAQQHHDALELLSKFHDVVITDLGSSGLRDMPEVLQTATDVVVVTGTSMDAVDRSRKVLDRLEELGHERLAREAVVAVVTRTTKDGTLAKAARNGGVHVETLISHFQKRCRATVLIPYSARLADGVHVDYETLDSDVNEAYRRIAGFLANGFRPALDRQTTPEGAGADSRAPLATINTAATPTTPAVSAKIQRGRGRRNGVETPAPSAFAELPHYQGS